MFDKIIEIITTALEWVQQLLERIDASTLPEWTGAVMAKSVRFFVDDIAPLLNEYIKIFFQK